MENVHGVTSTDLVLWKRADKTLFGIPLDEHGRARKIGHEEGAILGILPKGTPLSKLYVSSFEGHYECILGVNYVQLPAEAVRDTSPGHVSDAKATLPQRRLARPKSAKNSK